MAVNQTLVVERVRRLLLDKPYAFTSSQTVTGDTLIKVASSDRWNEGHILEWQDTGEQAYVTGTSGATGVNVIRGWNNTTITGHTGAVQVLYQNPFYTYAQIADAVALTCEELYPYAYKKVTTTIVPLTGSPSWYNLAADAVGLISVTQADTTVTPTRLWTFGQRGSQLPVSFQMNLPTGVAASTVGLMFPRGFPETVDVVQVDYAARVTATVSTGTYSDFMEGPLVDAIVYGAAARLVEAGDAARVGTVDTNMHDASIQPGARARMGQQYWQKFQIYKNIYFEQLRREMPLMYGAAGPLGRSFTARGTAYGANSPF